MINQVTNSGCSDKTRYISDEKIQIYILKMTLLKIITMDIEKIIFSAIKLLTYQITYLKRKYFEVQKIRNSHKFSFKFIH